MSDETTFKLSLGALFAALASMAGGISVWVKTREDIATLKAQNETTIKEFARGSEKFDAIDATQQEILKVLYEIKGKMV